MKWLKVRETGDVWHTDWQYFPLFENSNNKKAIKIVDEILNKKNERKFYSEKLYLKDDRGIEYKIINTNKVPNSEIFKALADSETKRNEAKKLFEKEKKHFLEVSKIVGKGTKKLILLGFKEKKDNAQVAQLEVWQ